MAKKRILVIHGANTKIAAEIGCSVNTVKNALRGAYDTELSNRIRELAKKKYAG